MDGAGRPGALSRTHHCTVPSHSRSVEALPISLVSNWGPNHSLIVMVVYIRLLQGEFQINGSMIIVEVLPIECHRLLTFRMPGKNMPAFIKSPFVSSVSRTNDYSMFLQSLVAMSDTRPSQPCNLEHLQTFQIMKNTRYHDCGVPRSFTG